MMRAAVATGYEDIDAYLHVKQDWPKPTLATAVDGKTGKQVLKLKGQRHMIVKVLACALAPGDSRVFKGRTDMMQLPKWGRPYVIGSDICGVVTEIAPSEEYFQIGDRIVARFDEPQPNGMCAEFACVKTHLSEKCPTKIPPNEACTLPASAAAAKLIATKFIKAKDRVLVLGGSGGVGTFLIQYAKNQGASFIAATSTQDVLLKSLGVDRVIDYREEKWWQLEKEFGGKDKGFDVVFDLVNGRNWQDGACSGTKVLKQKHTIYAQLLPGVETEVDARRGFISVLPFVATLVGRMAYAKINRSCPRYKAAQGLKKILEPGDLQSVLDDVTQEKVRVILDPAGPFQLNSDSVRAAMKLQRSTHAHGKVVIEITNNPDIVNNN